MLEDGPYKMPEDGPYIMPEVGPYKGRDDDIDKSTQIPVDQTTVFQICM